jgi:hypothetical protein
VLQLSPADAAQAQIYQASTPVVPKIPVADMERADLMESSCTMIYDILLDGSTQVRGVTDSPSCIDASYRSAWQALTAAQYPPATSPRLGKMRIVFRRSDSGR